MADVIEYKIYGDDLQLVEIELDPGEGVRRSRDSEIRRGWPGRRPAWRAAGG